MKGGLQDFGPRQLGGTFKGTGLGGMDCGGLKNSEGEIFLVQTPSKSI